MDDRPPFGNIPFRTEDLPPHEPGVKEGNQEKEKVRVHGEVAEAPRPFRGHEPRSSEGNEEAEDADEGKRGCDNVEEEDQGRTNPKKNGFAHGRKSKPLPRKEEARNEFTLYQRKSE